MKFLFLFITLFSLNSRAEVCTFVLGASILDEANKSMLQHLSAEIKTDFKRRKFPDNRYKLAINIESNFEVPLVGNTPYFGQIYLTNRKDIVAYRDEIIASKHYREESQDPKKFYLNHYTSSEINRASGLNLIKATGASVTIKSNGKFNTTQGGRLHLHIKAPKTKAFVLTFDVVINDGKVQNYVISGNKRFPFDTLKINAEKGLFGTPSILSGIESIQFLTSDKVVHTIGQ